MNDPMILGVPMRKYPKDELPYVPASVILDLTPEERQALRDYLEEIRKEAA